MRKQQLQHYLISIPLRGGYAHGYVMIMDKDKGVLLNVVERLMKEAQDQGFECWLPVVLQTHLDDGWKLVREVATTCCGPQPQQNWAKVKDFHLTGWFMSENHPDTARLMALH